MASLWHLVSDLPRTLAEFRVFHQFSMFGHNLQNVLSAAKPSGRKRFPVEDMPGDGALFVAAGAVLFSSA
jgi:hypothetical protein